MKYAIVIPDGCADEPQEALGGKTPLEQLRSMHQELGRSGCRERERVPGKTAVQRDSKICHRRGIRDAPATAAKHEPHVRRLVERLSALMICCGREETMQAVNVAEASAEWITPPA